MEGGRPSPGLDSVPETVPASSAARAHVDGAEREDEAPGTAGAGPGRLHGAGAELAVAAGQQLQAGALRLGQSWRVETAVSEVALVAGADPQSGEARVVLRLHLQGGDFN